MTAAPNKSPLTSVIDADPARRFRSASCATPALCIEHSVTTDMADGQPLPPCSDHGVVWQVVRRIDDRTIWRRLSLSLSSSPSTSPVTVWRTPGDQTRAP